MNDYFYLQILKFALNVKDKMLIGYAVSKIENTLFSRQSELLMLAESGDYAQLLSLVENLLALNVPNDEAKALQSKLARYLSDGVDDDEEELFFEDKFAFFERILQRQNEFFYKIKTQKTPEFKPNSAKNSHNLKQNSKEFKNDKFAQETSSQTPKTQGGVSVFIDEELEALKNEYFNLQELYAEKLELKEEILSCYDEFNRAYYQHFGELLREILTLQKILAKNAIKNAKNEQERAEKQRIYDDINAQEEELKTQANKKPKIQLNEADEKELKALYRRAVKLCHPDMIGSDEKIVLFRKVNEAYQNKDLQGLKEFLWELESGWANVLEDLQNENLAQNEQKERLNEMINSLKERLARLEDEIKSLQKNAHFDIVKSPKSWGAFFAKEKIQLESELAGLREELKRQDLE